MKYLISFSLLVILSTAAQSGLSQDIGKGGENTDLDLPFSPYFGGASTTAEEEAAEVIFFYGEPYEGDAFVFCVDRSGSMRSQGELDRAKREICRNIEEFADGTEFAVCFFDTQVSIWPATGSLVAANDQTREAAIAWVSSVEAGGCTCPQEGLTKALDAINKSQRSRLCIMYVGDGGGTCFKDGWQQTCPAGAASSPVEFESWYLTETLEVVEQANLKNVSINTIGVMLGADFNVHHDFVRKLARFNDGTYRRIE